MAATDVLAETAKRIDKAAEQMERSNSHSVSSIHFHGSSGLTIVGITAIIVAVAAVLVIAAWRSADMAQLKTVRDDVDMAAAGIEQHERRVTNLEHPK